VSCVWQHESCSASSHVTTSVVLCENYIDCQSVNESVISCVFSSTRHYKALLVPTVTNIVNLSLSSGNFHHTLKESVISPLFKKPTLDKDELSNYRPISNLSLLSKIIERVVKARLIIHHSFTLSLQAQNLPFQQILPTLDFFYLPDCLHDNGTAHRFIFSFTF